MIAKNIELAKKKEDLKERERIKSIERIKKIKHELAIEWKQESERKAKALHHQQEMSKSFYNEVTIPKAQA